VDAQRSAFGIEPHACHGHAEATTQVSCIQQQSVLFLKTNLQGKDFCPICYLQTLREFVELNNWVRGVQALALGSFEGSDGGTISLSLRQKNWPTCASCSLKPSKVLKPLLAPPGNFVLWRNFKSYDTGNCVLASMTSS
jgi:hypothetical protein